MRIKSKIAAVGLGAVALAGLIGVGASYADNPTPSTSPSASSSPSDPGSRAGGSTQAAPKGQTDRGTRADPSGHGRHAERALLKRALHGEVTIGGEKQTRVMVFQRGAVDKVSATSITVKSTDGFAQTYVVNADTSIRKDGHAAEIADLAAGDKVRVVALKNGSTSTARVIAEPKDR